ncbi:MAG: MBOAT family protein [Pedosphaera sp.]|nr:MBOAT family protein [Pedosphaera sp.]
MLFNSLHFLAFFTLVTPLYYLLPHRYRALFLLAGSCYFYMAFVPVYILILGFTILIDYVAGIGLDRTKGSRRKWLLIASLVANISVLAVFKYYNFINESLSGILNLWGAENPFPMLSILLPIGLSFHTFQAMSYTIEVYRGNQRSEPNLVIYSLYVMFYPQLVAGPIERPQNLLRQFREEHEFDYQRIVEGLKLMAWGLFKKVVIADRLAPLPDAIFNDVQQYHGLGLALAIGAFSVQIYCDFSGYSDIAIGAARVMGFTLMTNFDRPYHARTIAEFWRRWHISLTTWFKDYLYIPLGGSRVPVPRWYLNLVIVFVISGLWHGPNWTFVLWGLLHSFYLIFGLLTQRTRDILRKASGLSARPNLAAAVQRLCTFTLVTIAWVFFRANTVQDALYVLTHLTQGLQQDINNLIYQRQLNLGFGQRDLLIALAAVAFMEFVHWAQYRGSVSRWISQQPGYIRWPLYYAAVLTIVFLGVHGDRQFIYFQF